MTAQKRKTALNKIESSFLFHVTYVTKYYKELPLKTIYSSCVIGISDYRQLRNIAEGQEKRTKKAQICAKTFLETFGTEVEKLKDVFKLFPDDYEDKHDWENLWSTLDIFEGRAKQA